MNKLPKIPSQLIRLAIEDLKQVMNDDRYRIDMDIWHGRYYTGTCMVCLAGSVMAKTFDANLNSSLSPLDFEDPYDISSLYALDFLRAGSTHSASTITKNPLFNLIPSRQITAFEEDNFKFINEMLAMADEYELAEKEYFQKKQKDETI